MFEYPEDDIIIIEDEKGLQHAVTLDHYKGPLKPNTIYSLKVSEVTKIERNIELEEDGEGEEEDEETEELDLEDGSDDDVDGEDEES